MKCRSCDIEKEDSEFHVRKDRSNRLRPYCKLCSNDIVRARYNAHKRFSPFKLRCSRAKARSLFLNLPFDLTPEYLQSIWTGKCPVTNKNIFLFETERHDENAAELDRMVPSLGYIQGNVTFLSRRINRLKNNATVEELELLIEWMKNHEV